MSVEAIAQQFTTALKSGDFEAAERMWSEDVVSIEAMDGPMREARGREAVHAKGVWWNDTHIVHGFEAEGPFVNGDRFALILKMDTTNKEDNQRTQMNEVALYTVRGDQIAEERFFY